ncbi:hypothetical protein [Methylobacterium sp. WSM2598]|uniref:hypothetical protein n=1 Tax=Methylobacterium sp. WSM2598 TaxID=398261 RepID=UPI0003A4EE59|nr:hypothetical protein [Methylobacterium sp. WSM2598]
MQTTEMNGHQPATVVAASTLQPKSIDARDPLAGPGGLFCHPDDVLDHPGLCASEKRAILASWASDANALENAPALRQTDSGAIVPVDDILAALGQLDGVVAHRAPRSNQRRWTHRRLTPRSHRSVYRLRRQDDDDDPPPCPAAARRQAAFLAVCA